jgi:hypothetical protein
MKRPKVIVGFFLLFVFGAIASFFCAAVVSIDVIQTSSIKNTIAVVFFLAAACCAVRFAFECKNMEFPKQTDTAPKT